MSNTINSMNLILNKSGGNPYHDKLGRFTTGPGGGGGSSTSKGGSEKSTKTGGGKIGRSYTNCSAEEETKFDTAIDKYQSTEEWAKNEAKLTAVVVAEDAAYKQKSIKEAVAKAEKKFKDIRDKSGDESQGSFLADKEYYYALEQLSGARDMASSATKMRHELEREITKDIQRASKEEGLKISQYKIKSFIGTYNNNPETEGYGSYVVQIEKR